MKKIIKFVKTAPQAFDRAPLRQYPWLVLNVLIIIGITLPLLFLAGFTFGVASLQNPFKAGIKMIEEIL